MTIIESALGEELQSLRLEKGWTLASVGERLGAYLGKHWSPQAVWQAENGKRDFKIAEVAAFAMVFQIPLHELVSTLYGSELPSAKLANPAGPDDSLFMSRRDVNDMIDEIADSVLKRRR